MTKSNLGRKDSFFYLLDNSQSLKKKELRWDRNSSTAEFQKQERAWCLVSETELQMKPSLLNMKFPLFSACLHLSSPIPYRTGRHATSNTQAQVSWWHASTQRHTLLAGTLGTRSHSADSQEEELWRTGLTTPAYRSGEPSRAVRFTFISLFPECGPGRAETLIRENGLSSSHTSFWVPRTQFLGSIATESTRKPSVGYLSLYARLLEGLAPFWRCYNFALISVLVRVCLFLSI